MGSSIFIDAELEEGCGCK